jgi:ATP-dependent DNA ligase
MTTHDTAYPDTGPRYPRPGDRRQHPPYLLQQRLAGGQAKAAAHAREWPASFVVFDLLADRGENLRGLLFLQRRARLEAMTWAAPFTLSPITDDEQQARAWMEQYRPAGVEGLVAKSATGRYEPGARRWLKYKTRETVEVLVGGVTGSLARPESLIAGRYRDGQLVSSGGPFR